MLEQVLEICSPQKGGLFIDCTFGSGGYSDAILSFPKTKVIAIDRDIETNKYVTKIKKKYRDRFKFYNLKFSELNKVVSENTKVDNIIFDLGLSSIQIKNLERGFSFKSKSKLLKISGALIQPAAFPQSKTTFICLSSVILLKIIFL